MIDRTLQLFPALLTVAALAACSGSDGGATGPDPSPEPPRPTISVSPSSAVFTALGEIAAFAATVRDQNSAVMDVEIDWSSDDPSVVEVDGSGRATAISNGSVTVTATVSELTATAQVEVQAPVALSSGVPLAGLSGQTDSEFLFTIEVGSAGGGDPTAHPAAVAAAVVRGAGTQKFTPAGRVRPGAVSGGSANAFANALRISLSGGGGGQDADLYVKFGSQPTRTDFDFSSLSSTSTESVTISDPRAGTWYIMVHAFTAYSDVTLTAELGDFQEEGHEEATGYDIELVFLSEATESQLEAFETARLRWEEAISAGLPDFDFGASPLATDTCIEGQDEISDVVDDLRIFIDLQPIDGTFGTLARAGPCWLRNSLLTIVGSMAFDTADLTHLENNDQLVPVILHEMGHVLGIGSLWEPSGLLQNPSREDNQGADTHFSGESAIAAFDAAGGDAYTAGEKVPVENNAVAGSADAHWRESVLDEELMTPSLNSGSNPLSAISLASLIDLGYEVDTAQADEFTLDLGAPSPARLLSTPLSLHGDVIDRPILVIGTDGRVQRVIRR